MDSMTPTHIKKIAHLARLALSEQEVTSLATDLDNIFNFINKMNAIETTKVKPLAHPMDAKQRLRADLITEIDQRELYLSIAPATADGLYLVPDVIETET